MICPATPLSDMQDLSWMQEKYQPAPLQARHQRRLAAVQRRAAIFADLSKAGELDCPLSARQVAPLQ